MSNLDPKIKQAVENWQNNDYEGVSQTTRRLLEELIWHSKALKEARERKSKIN